MYLHINVTVSLTGYSAGDSECVTKPDAFSVVLWNIVIVLLLSVHTAEP